MKPYQFMAFGSSDPVLKILQFWTFTSPLKWSVSLRQDYIVLYWQWFGGYENEKNDFHFYLSPVIDVQKNC